MTIVIIIIIVVVVGGVIISNISLNTTIHVDEETKERRRLLAEKFQREAEKKEKIQREVEEKEIQEYGNCTNSIKWWFDSKTFLIRVFEESKTIFIKKEKFSFSDIIGVNFVDNANNAKTMSTTTDNKNMFGRAVVGGLLAGGLGAVVGAATAKQRTSCDKNEVHDYFVLINTKILSKPLIVLRIGNNISQVNEIIAILNAVIANNK